MTVFSGPPRAKGPAGEKGGGALSKPKSEEWLPSCAQPDFSGFGEETTLHYLSLCKEDLEIPSLESKRRLGCLFATPLPPSTYFIYVFPDRLPLNMEAPSNHPVSQPRGRGASSPLTIIRGGYPCVLGPPSSSVFFWGGERSVSTYSTTGLLL